MSPPSFVLEPKAFAARLDQAGFTVSNMRPRGIVEVCSFPSDYNIHELEQVLKRNQISVKLQDVNSFMFQLNSGGGLIDKKGCGSLFLTNMPGYIIVEGLRKSEDFSGEDLKFPAHIYPAAACKRAVEEFTQWWVKVIPTADHYHLKLP